MVPGDGVKGPFAKKMVPGDGVKGPFFKAWSEDLCEAPSPVPTMYP